jgi:hypothetical protein
VVLPQSGEGGGGREIAQEGDALAQLRLQSGQGIIVAAAAQLRHLRAQLFAFRPVLVAPQFSVEAVVDVGQKFPLILAQRFGGHRIETPDRFAPCGSELAVGGGGFASLQVASSRAVFAVRQSNDGSAAAAGAVNAGASSNVSTSGKARRSIMTI